MKIGVSVYSERWALNLFLNVNNVFDDCISAGRAFHEMIARGKKLFNVAKNFVEDGKRLQPNSISLMIDLWGLRFRSQASSVHAPAFQVGKKRTSVFRIQIFIFQAQHSNLPRDLSTIDTPRFFASVLCTSALPEVYSEAAFRTHNCCMCM